MITAPMLADFAVRLALGLSIATVLVSWRTVPLPFFRTQQQIILGLLALAALDQARASGTGISFWIIIAGAVLAYVSSIAWGLGLPGVGVGTAAGCAAAGTLWLLTASRGAGSLRTCAQRSEPRGVRVLAGGGALLDAPGTLLPDRAGHDGRAARAHDRARLPGGSRRRAVLAGVGWHFCSRGWRGRLPGRVIPGRRCSSAGGGAWGSWPRGSPPT